MNLLYSWPQNSNSSEAAPRVSKIHDKSQSMYPAKLAKGCESGRCILYSSIPSSRTCVCQSQNAPIDRNKYEGDCLLSAYVHPLSEVNNISNSFSMHHENNSGEINSAGYFKVQNESSGLNPKERGNTFLSSQDFMGKKSTSLTAQNKTCKINPGNAEIAANILVGSRPHIDFQARDLKGPGISRPSGNKDRHRKVLTLKGPRDRRIRLSVGTAIKLYCVQDMLGVEQPSQAVEWLIEKSQEVIRKLPQLSCISRSHRSEFVQSDRVAVSAACHQTGVPSTSTQDNRCTESGDFLVNLEEQILAAKTVIGHKTFTAMSTKAGTKNSIVHGEKVKQRSIAVTSMPSNHGARETVNRTLPQKERRAKARERARERTEEKGKHCKQHRISGILQRSYVRPHSPAFSLHDNTTSASSLNMMNEAVHGIDNSNTLLRSLMFPKDSIPLSHSRLCASFPPAETQCSFRADVHYSTAQLEGISVESKGAFFSVNPEVVSLAPDPFPEAVGTANNTSSYIHPCKCAFDHTHQKSSNLSLYCREDSREMQGTYNGRLDKSYESQSAWNTENFEEIPALKPSSQLIHSRISETNTSSLSAIFGLPQ